MDRDESRATVPVRISAQWIAIGAFFLLLAPQILAEMWLGIDWLPLWAAGRAAVTDPAALYDFHRITELQWVIYQNLDFRPFVYPPSALILVAPLATLSFGASLALLSGGSLVALAIAAKKAGSDPVLMAIAPPMVIALAVGQMSLLVLALAMAACLLLPRDERTAGIMFALAALLKPTLLVLAPIGLIAGRHWRALAYAGATGMAGMVVSLLLFGIQPWIDWLAALPRFQQLFSDYPPLVKNAISPYALAVRLGIEHGSIMILFAVPATIFAWLAFSRPIDPVTRVTILLGGALLITPYAMNYELAALAPAMLAYGAKRQPPAPLVAVWAFSIFLTVGIVGLIVGYAWVVAPLAKSLARSMSKRFHEAIMQPGVDISAGH